MKDEIRYSKNFCSVPRKPFIEKQPSELKTADADTDADADAEIPRISPTRVDSDDRRKFFFLDDFGFPKQMRNVSSENFGDSEPNRTEPKLASDLRTKLF